MPNDESVPLWQAAAAGVAVVPVAKPRLPSADRVVPYLRRIDQSGWYSNGGPLVQELEERLALHAGGGKARAATVANATIGLALALLAREPPPGALCMVPSWTFAASGHAILLAGLVPWMVDVNADTWALEPDAARGLLAAAPGPVAAVLPVSPFGALLDLAGWRRFQAETGVAVIVDAAAMFDRVRATDLPTVVSLHATKVCGIGEGGFVLSTDESFIEEVQKRANFGFWYSREATARSLNGKISEYAAAVGLAALDAWPETRADFLRVASGYRKLLGEVGPVRLQKGTGEDFVSATILLRTAEGEAKAVAGALETEGIGTRYWWGGGLHRHRAFVDFPRTELPQTDVLAASTVGLPCWRDLPREVIARICEIVGTTAPGSL